MKTVKLIAVILLAMYVFFTAVFNLFQYLPSGGIAFLVGLAGVGAGVLILLSSRKWLHFHDDK